MGVPRREWPPQLLQFLVENLVKNNFCLILYIFLIDMKILVDIIGLLKKCGFPEVRWYDLGLRLGLQKNTLDVIENNHPKDASRCLTECLSRWLSIADGVESRGGATYDSLSNAIRLIDENAVAANLDKESESCIQQVKGCGSVQ